MSEQDQKAFQMYGKLPGKNLVTKMQKVRKLDFRMWEPVADGAGPKVL